MHEIVADAEAPKKTARYIPAIYMAILSIVLRFGRSHLPTRFDEWSALPASKPLLGLLLWFAFYSTRRRTTGEREIVIAVFPIGIQLFRRQKGSQSLQNTLFIPRDQFVDCIVTEHILAHRVESIVVLRIRPRKAQGPTEAFELIEAFPGGREMTYVECLSKRNEIMDATSVVVSEKVTEKEC